MGNAYTAPQTHRKAPPRIGPHCLGAESFLGQQRFYLPRPVIAAVLGMDAFACGDTALSRSTGSMRRDGGFAGNLQEVAEDLSQGRIEVLVAIPSQDGVIDGVGYGPKDVVSLAVVDHQAEHG